ncbi:MAG: glycosyltransferase family 4 protein [Bryobacterales bacterium]|nr:glycosyltransferase family 4 protein [Bryobacterales bacterium]
MPIKTLHLTYLFNEQSGGIATFYRAMMRRATDAGRQMVMVIPGERWEVEQVSDTVRIYRVQAAHSLIGDRRYRVLLPHHFLFPGDTQFKQILRQEQPDVVEACDKYSLFYLFGYLRLGWLGCETVPTTVATTMERMDDNFLTYFGSTPPGRRFCEWYMRQIYFPMPKYHIAISRYVADELEQAPAARRLDKIRVLPLGVDSQTFRPPIDGDDARKHLRAAIGAGEGSRVLLYAGRLSREKNIPLLIGTLRDLLRDAAPRFHLAVIGGGPLRSELEGLSRTEFRGRLNVMPHVESRERLAALIGGADAFVHPNPHEPFGIGPLEAMACGLPVVLPNQGGVLEYANSTNSWPTVPDPVSYANAVRDAIATGVLRESRIAAARATAEALDWCTVTERFFGQYESFHQMAKGSKDPWPIPYAPWPWSRRRTAPHSQSGDEGRGKAA